MKKSFKIIIIIVFLTIMFFSINIICNYLVNKSDNNFEIQTFDTEKEYTNKKTSTINETEIYKKEDLFFEEYNSEKGIKILYHIYQNININEDTGLMIYFHGDNANDFNNGKNSKRINLLVDVVKNHNLLPIAIKTPSDDLTWWKDGERNSYYVNEFINEFLLKEFKINKNRVLLVGYSGGAEFLTENFIWRYFQEGYKGGAIMIAGGSKPLNNVEFKASFIKNFKLYFYSGTEDFMHNKIIVGVNYFEEKGFDVKTEYPNGEDHFDIPFYTIVEEQLNSDFLN